MTRIVLNIINFFFYLTFIYCLLPSFKNKNYKTGDNFNNIILPSFFILC